MKWFKHMTNASDDTFIAGLEETFGLEGYARWWKLLEAVAAQMKKGGRPAAAYPWVKWQTLLRGKRNKLETFLERLRNESRINTHQTGNVLEIEVPNLLKFLDEYSTRVGTDSGATRDPVRASSSASTSGFLFQVEEDPTKKRDREEDSLAVEPPKKKRELTEHQLQVKAVEDAIATYGGEVIPPPLIAKYIRDFGLEEIVAAIHDIGPPGHLSKGAPYLYRTLERRRDERNGNTKPGDNRTDRRGARGEAGRSSNGSGTGSGSAPRDTRFDDFTFGELPESIRNLDVPEPGVSKAKP